MGFSWKFSEKEWYFFSPIYRKYSNGSWPNRVAGSGYGKAIRADHKIITIKVEKLESRKVLDWSSNEFYFFFFLWQHLINVVQVVEHFLYGKQYILSGLSNEWLSHRRQHSIILLHLMCEQFKDCCRGTSLLGPLMIWCDFEGYISCAIYFFQENTNACWKCMER